MEKQFVKPVFTVSIDDELLNVYDRVFRVSKISLFKRRVRITFKWYVIRKLKSFVRSKCYAHGRIKTGSN